MVLSRKQATCNSFCQGDLILRYQKNSVLLKTTIVIFSLATTPALAQEQFSIVSPGNPENKITISPSQTQSTPDYPKSISAMVKEGATASFLGSDLGLNGWLIQKDNQAQTVYSTLDGNGVVIGILYDQTGIPVTEVQLSAISTNLPERATDNTEVKPELDNLVQRLKAAPGAVFGTSGPLLHVFMDPQCPFCHGLWQEAQTLTQEGKIRIHVIPVGLLGPSSAELTSQILGGETKHYWQLAMQNRNVNVEHHELRIGANLTENNNRLFFDWNGNGVPLIVFEKDGELAIHNGKPDTLESLFR